MTPFWKITNQAAGTQVLLYGMIGRDWDGSGNDPKEFLDAWMQIPKGPIDLHIHSPGGYVFDGLAIYNTVATRKADVTAYVDGLAASTASWIACAANKVVMPKTARMMIHDAQGFVIGDSETMREQAELLDKESDRVAQMYADKTGKSKDKMRDLMRATTWMDGSEAKEIGLADEVTDASAQPNNYNLSCFRRVPEADGGLSPANAATKPNQPKETSMKPDTTAGQTPQPNIASTQPVDHAAEIERLRAALEVERTNRITNQLHTIAATRPGIDVAKWLPEVMKNDALIENLKAFPESGAPIPGHMITNAGNPLLEAYNKMLPGKERMAFRVMNHDMLVRTRTQFELRGGPVNANTLAAGLIPDYLADGIIMDSHNKLAMITAFSRNFTLDVLRPRASVEVANWTAGPTVQSNATSFESGDSTLAAVQVTVNQLTASFHISNAAQNQGFQLQQLATGAAYKLVDAVSDVCTALMTNGNYSADNVIGAAASFDYTDLPAIWVLGKNWPRKNLVLDGSYLGYLIPRTRDWFTLGEAGAYGFDLIAENNRWTSAATDIVGIVCAPDGMAVASGVPVAVPAGEFYNTGTATMKNGLTVQYNAWFSKASRTIWASYDIMFGAAVGDKDQLEILTSA